MLLYRNNEIIQLTRGRENDAREKRKTEFPAKTLRRDIGRICRSVVALGVRTNTGETISPGAQHYSSRSLRCRV